MSILSRIVNYFIHGGSWVVRPYEHQIIETAAKTLPEPDGNSLLRQLKFLDHVKRLHKDRMVTFYFETSKAGFPYLQYRDPELPLAKLSIQSSKGSFAVHVVAHRGVLSSLEFAKSPSHLKNESLIIKKIEVSGISPSNLAEEIDMSEHR